MSKNISNELLGISRQAEESYLARTLDVIHDNVTNYGRDVVRMRDEIDEMLEHFHDDNPELINLLENTITMHDHMKRALERNERALEKPYFGRIIFHDETLGKDESIYVGRGGISKDATTPVVVDWRAPVANAYYENGLGKCSYPSPDGRQIDIDLKLKRTYEIENGKLKNFFDSEVISNDELLTKYLAQNKQAVLGDIVATIQQEQNAIIRRSPYHNVIVQGVAGSGKTTVAMHRISFILYNYADRFKPGDFYIVGSNRILLNYITGVLPSLDVYGVRQMTMEQLFIRLLYEDWDEKKYRIKNTGRSIPTCDADTTDITGTAGSTSRTVFADTRGVIKGSLSWFKDLQEYCRKLEWNTILRESIYLNPKQFVEGLRDGKPGVYDETGGKPANPEDLVLLVDGAAVERYIRQNPAVSIQSKIDMLNERLNTKVKDEFLGKGIKYTEPEKKAIMKAYRGKYGANVWKKSIFELYNDFLTCQIAKGHDVEIPTTHIDDSTRNKANDTAGNNTRKIAFDVYDLAALAYLYKRVKETEVIREASHVVIDEAQDFGMMAYSVLKFCIRDCTYTIMGDVSQNIHFGYGLNDWEELKELYLPDSMDHFDILKKSYRNTVEISNFATNILHHGQFSIYPVEPIIRHGNPAAVYQVSDRHLLIQKAAAVCKEWQKKGLGTIAVICRDQESAARTAEDLRKHVEIMESDPETAEFGNGIMVLPVEYTKGLEFDAVLIINPTREDYPVDDGHAKLLYVAATRALHELCVLHTGNLTGLIADPVPERSATEAAAPTLTPQTNAGPGQTTTPKTPGRKSVIISTPTDKRPLNVRTAKPQVKSTGALQTDYTRTGPRPIQTDYTLTGSRPIQTDYTLTGPRPIQTDYTKAGLQKPIQTEPIPEVRRPATGISFGDLPATEKLRPVGHSKIDLAVRWVSRQSDGLYIQSRYGLLRLSPITSSIIRVTFTTHNRIVDGVHPQIEVKRTERAWMFKESPKIVELTTDELCLQLDKSTGAITYMTRDKKILLAERSKECRQMQPSSIGPTRNWFYLNWQKGENLYGISAVEKTNLNLKGTARYISHGENAEELPFLLSDKGYGILVASDGPTLCCDIPSYGSYLYTESPDQMDYYFIAGKKSNTILSAYAYLCGKTW